MVKPIVRPNPGRALNFFSAMSGREVAAKLIRTRRRGKRNLRSSPVGLTDLVEDTAVVEVCFLSLLPAAKHFVDGEQFQLRKLAGILLHDRFEPGTIVVPRDNVLAGFAIEIFEIPFGCFLRSTLPGYLVNHGHGRFSQDADGRGNYFELPRTKLFNCHRSEEHTSELQS